MTRIREEEEDRMICLWSLSLVDVIIVVIVVVVIVIVATH